MSIPTAARDDFYVKLLMQEWRLNEQSEEFQARVRRVLLELNRDSQEFLCQPKLEVMVRADAGFSVWAYFPINRRRLIARTLQPRPETRVLLVFNAEKFVEQELGQSEAELRDHLGHTLLYLTAPKAPNECSDAWWHWLGSVHDAAHAEAVRAKRLQEIEAAGRKESVAGSADSLRGTNARRSS